jgi:hypothetical protein
MLHLFNKAYLELDDKIELNIDRVVISEINGVPVADSLTRVVQGVLINYNKNLDNISFVDLINQIHTHGQTSNKRIVVYCDKFNYIKFATKWLKTLLPNLDLNSFSKLIELTIYKERIISNSQMQSVVPVKQDTLWEGLGDVSSSFNSITVSNEDRQSIKNLNLKYSYEFVLADHFSGSSDYTSSLKTVVHLFLQRWFKELFKDNREMVLLNLLNKNFQTALNFTETNIDLTSSNPISAVSSLQYYSDNTIWSKENTCNIEGLEQQQIDGLRNLVKKIYGDVEGMEIDNAVFGMLDYLEYSAKTSITTEELNTILNFVVQNPFDTCLIPKFDFQNVNFVFVQHLLNLKRDNNTGALTKFRLL